MDIHKGLGNANKIMNRLFLMDLKISDCRLLKSTEEVYATRFRVKVLQK